MPKFLRRVALLVVALLMAAGLPAQADPYKSKLCWTFYEDGKLRIYCVDIQFEWPWEWYEECYVCGLGLDWRYDDPVIRDKYGERIAEQIATGLQTLGTADFTRDPALRTKLEAQALDEFAAAARLTGTSAIRPGAVGIADPDKNTLAPADLPWAKAGAQDVTDGIALLQRSFSDPAAAPRLRTLAAAQFAEAYDELATQKAIGS